MTIFTKTAIAAITTVALLAGSLTATTTSASAGSNQSYTYGNRYNTTAQAPRQHTTWRNSAGKRRQHMAQPRQFRSKRHKHRRDFAGPAAAGLIFGLAASAVVAGSRHSGAGCYWVVKKRRIVNEYGEVVVIKKRVRNCD